MIVPCRNERDYIEAFLQNVLSQDYPKDRLDIWIADGRSDDGTREILDRIAAEHPSIHWIDNPEGIVPPALNACIRASSGEVVVRLDAHSMYPEDYIRTLVEHLIALEADNVGGVWITEPANESAEAVAIALATSHPLGIGDSEFRLENEEVKAVDTVPYGCYRREVFDKIGLFDPDLTRNQDDEFNARLLRSGGRIFLIPQVKIRYFARPTRAKMRRMFYHYGLFKPLVNAKIGSPTTIRQFIPPLLVIGQAVIVLGLLLDYRLGMGLLFAAWLPYLGLITWVSARLARQHPGKNLFWHLVRTFPMIHFSYGWGYLLGFGKVWAYLRGKRVKAVGISR